MADLDALLDSFTDQWVLFDSVEAAGFGDRYPRPSLEAFDQDHARQHAAGFRSLAAAIEDLDLDPIDAEIDRTILLAAVRTRLRRIESEHPERSNPALWCHRLAIVTKARGGEADTLDRIPRWTAAAQATLVKPPLVHLQVALDHLASARAQLESETWWQSDKESLSRAIAAVEGLEGFLRHEVEPDPEPAAGALGIDGVEWRLQHEHLIRFTGATMAERLAHRIEALDARVAEPSVGAGGREDDRIGESLGAPAPLPWGPRVSAIRRQLVPPAWAAAWRTFAGSFGDGRRTGAAAFLADQARLGAIDLGIQLSQMTPAGEARRRVELGASESAALEAVGALLLNPLTEAATAFLAADWEATRRLWSGGDQSFFDAVRESGLYHPALIAWKLDLA